MLRENSKTRRALRRVFRKAEDAGLLAQVKDDNAAKGVPERPAGMCALVKRRYRTFMEELSKTGYLCLPFSEGYDRIGI